jgi:hypothetical protein
MGGLLPFAGPRANGEVAPFAAIPGERWASGGFSMKRGVRCSRAGLCNGTCATSLWGDRRSTYDQMGSTAERGYE